MPFADPLGLVGQRLGPYVVREIATAGGVALIYRGEHEALKSAVAVKVLRPELVEDAVRLTLEQMFLREAQILSQLRSDDILRALDHGSIVCPTDGAERPYIVVDWLEGQPLIEDLERRALERERRPYTLPEALELLEPIARALAVCHEAGIVHRDVNPRNVFLENLGPDRLPRAKLIDFGFAKEVARTEALRLQRVDGTLFARSPDYAAPEHYDRIKYGELSENTDIYTFALMLVEMLTLEPPLRGFTDADLREATTNRDDRPTPNNRGAHLPAEIEALFAEALAIDQFERPGILWDFWTRLKDTASGSPAEPRPAPTAAVAELEHTAREPAPVSERPRGVPRKRRARTLMAVLALSVLGAGGIGAFLWSRQPLTCPAGFSDCNSKRTDGCEANLRADPSNCGACGSACRGGEDSLSCVEGQCRVTKCPAPHLGDCNQSPTDGCETDLRSDLKNCGECGRVCGSDGTKQALCLASKCQSSCRGGYGDCDGLTANGCEATLTNDPKNCGRCGVVCQDSECKDGLCAPKTLGGPVSARYLTAFQGGLYFWDADGHRIERVARDGQRTVVVADVSSVTGLAVGAGRVVWTTTENASLFAHPLEDVAAPVERVSGPLGSATPLVASANGYLSWANRAARADPEGARKHGMRSEVLPPASRRVFTAPWDALLDKAKTASVDCPEWPRTFIADGLGTYCCDGGKPLTRVDCKSAHCTNEPYDALCPDELTLDAERLYFAQDVRLLSLDRKTGRLKALGKRKKRPREVTLGSGFLYWLEGDRPGEVWRVAADPADGGVPEVLARHQSGASALAVGASAIYWVAESPQGSAIYALPLPSR